MPNLIPADDLAAIRQCHETSAPFQNDPEGSKGMYNKVREQRGRLLDHVEVLERELEQAAIRFETMHKTCANLTGMALIGGENCRTPLATPNK